MMNKIIKSLLAFSISSSLFINNAAALTYKVVDAEAAENVKYTYSQGFNNRGEMAISGVNSYNFPVLYDALDDIDFELIIRMAATTAWQVTGITPIQNPRALVAGEPVANDLYWVVRYLESKFQLGTYQQRAIPITQAILTVMMNQGGYQKVGSSIALTNFGILSGEQTEEFIIFDRNFNNEPTTNLDHLTRSTTDYVNGINDVGTVYGNASAPYLRFAYTQASGDEYQYFTRAFSTRGFYKRANSDEIIEILPPTDDPEQQPNTSLHFGGQSSILGLDSLGNFAVGFASTSINPNVFNQMLSSTNGCQAESVTALIPLKLCFEFYEPNLYNVNAMKWELNPVDGTASGEVLALLVKPHERDTRTYISVAQAINSSGVAVGYSHGWIDENEFNPGVNELRGIFAVVFKEDHLGNQIVQSFTEDHSKYFDSRAYDINDNGIAVGHTTLLINGTARTKAFFVNTNEENPIMTIPEGYFKGAASTARAVNNNGYFVGEGEVETHNDSPTNPRRKEAYIYDIQNEEVYNLNNLTECLSPYTIIEARDINDNNVIAATALIKANRKDSKGEDMLDQNGELLTEDVLRSVLLVPQPEGEVDPCPEEDNLVVRKGASFQFYGLILLFALLIKRRFFH